MKTSTSATLAGDPKRQRSFICSLLSTLLLLSAAFFIGSAFMFKEYRERFLGLGIVSVLQNSNSNVCETPCQPSGTQTLPKGIVSKTSDLNMHPLWGPENKKPRPMSLLAIAVGLKQKQNVDKIVKKFLLDWFVVMLFHYDGVVDDWKDLVWHDQAIHVAAVGQTKWWFAKRFLHPDVVTEYSYIFLWDEDLGVENFNAGRYLSIIIEEGLEISQPALDPDYSDVHYPFTARQVNSTVHRKISNISGGWKKCEEDTTEPPCAGYVEMMAPVFSSASWRCAWHMIQNDLIHAWGLDFQLGYCSQGDRTTKIGIVDSEYVVHYGLPTLGGSENDTASALSSGKPAPKAKSKARSMVKKRCFAELDIFRERWKKAMEEDSCWIDPYKKAK